MVCNIWLRLKEDKTETTVVVFYKDKLMWVFVGVWALFWL